MFLAQLAAKANQEIQMVDGDYIEDGLIFCGKCHTPKQTRPFRGIDPDSDLKVMCMCQCAKDAREAKIAEQKERERLERLVSMRGTCLRDPVLRACTFDTDDGQNPMLTVTAKGFCDNWPEAKRENQGMIFAGETGTGKTFMAACIANYIMAEYDEAAMMTNFSRILNDLFEAEDKNGYIADLMKYPLLIIDDFGIERNSTYATEQVYNVVNERYLSGRPMIITTNLTKSELLNPKNLEQRRIYERLTERCRIVDFGSTGRRASIAAKAREAFKKLIGVGGKKDGD